MAEPTPTVHSTRCDLWQLELGQLFLNIRLRALQEMSDLPERHAGAEASPQIVNILAGPWAPTDIPKHRNHPPRHHVAQMNPKVPTTIMTTTSAT